jgi:hypothetical protein
MVLGAKPHRDAVAKLEPMKNEDVAKKRKCPGEPSPKNLVGKQRR